MCINALSLSLVEAERVSTIALYAAALTLLRPIPVQKLYSGSPDLS
jgi:hypothetical protein